MVPRARACAFFLFLAYSIGINAFFSSIITKRNHHSIARGSKTNLFSSPSSLSSSAIEETKLELVRLCRSIDDGSSKKNDVLRLCNELLQQKRMTSNDTHLLYGKWSLLYASDDVTRSSPFFWAFRRAYAEDISSQIFGITDAVPAPLKEVGPATQSISAQKLVSRVRVATLGGKATSIMTTRCDVLGVSTSGSGETTTLDVRVVSTKPEESTALRSLLGTQLGGMVDEYLWQPFPSGDVLDQVKPGSSTVGLCHLYCDEGLRICVDSFRNDGPTGTLLSDGVEFYVWERTEFDNLIEV